MRISLTTASQVDDALLLGPCSPYATGSADIAGLHELYAGKKPLHGLKFGALEGSLSGRRVGPLRRGCQAAAV